jgi:hypothetical protein
MNSQRKGERFYRLQKPLLKKQTEGDTINKQSKDTPQNLIDSTEFSIKNPDETLKAVHTILSESSESCYSMLSRVDSGSVFPPVLW